MKPSGLETCFFLGTINLMVVELFRSSISPRLRFGSFMVFEELVYFCNLSYLRA